MSSPGSIEPASLSLFGLLGVVACGPVAAPIDGASSTGTSDSTSEASVGPTSDPSDPSDPSAPTEATTTPIPECQSDSECDDTYCGYCFDGACIEQPGCCGYDGVAVQVAGKWRCQPPYECYSDEDCGLGYACDFGRCIPTVPLPLPACDSPDGFGSEWNLGAAPSAFVLVDLDLDMDLDLAAAQPLSGTIDIALNDGAGMFVLAEGFPVGPGPHLELAAGDIDGDGDPDLAVAGSEPGVLRLMFNDGAKFAAGADFPIGPGPFAGQVFLADVDGDAALDLVVRRESDGSVAVRSGDGKGGFGEAQGAVPDPLTGRSTLFDLSGDGIADLVAPTSQPNIVRAYTGTTDQGFVPVANFITASELTTTLAGDLDDNGVADVAAVQPRDAGGLIEVWRAGAPLVWPQTPAGYLTSAAVVGGVLADIDAAGGLDLVSATSGPNVLVALNDHIGGFSCERFHDIAGDSRPGLLAVGDVDGDGRLDLVAGGAGTPTITVALFK